MVTQTRLNVKSYEHCYDVLGPEYQFCYLKYSFRRAKRMRLPPHKLRPYQQIISVVPHSSCFAVHRVKSDDIVF